MLIYPVYRSIVVDSLGHSIAEHQAVLYVFCNHKDPKTKDAESIFASLLQQLFQNRPFVSKELDLLYRFHVRRRTRPNLSEWLHHLRTEIALYSSVFVVIDAMDEFSDVAGAREDLFTELKRLPPNVHLLVTARPLPTLESDIPDRSRVEILARDEDIRSYLEVRIPNESRLLRQVKSDPAFREMVISHVIGAAKGM